MKTILFCGSVLRATPDERAARRPIGRDPEAWATMLAEVSQIAKWADEASSIDVMGTTEHHFQTEGGETVGNSLLMYSKFASETKRLSYMPLSLVLPVRDPIRTAEDVAIFDQIHPGRLAGVGFARGYQTRWMQTLAQAEKVSATPMDPVSDGTNRERFDEYLKIVELAWKEDSWKFAGKYYQVPFPAEGIRHWALAEWTGKYASPGAVDDEGTLHEVGVLPKPLKVPQVFVPTTFSEATITACAQHGRIPVIGRGPEDFRRACELFREESRKAGRELALGEGVAHDRPIVFGDTYEEALEIAVRGLGYWLRNFFAGFGILEGLRTPDDDPTKMLTFASDREVIDRMIDQGKMLVGTAEQIHEKLADVKGCYGGDGEVEWLSWEFWGQGIPGDEGCEIGKRQIELFDEAMEGLR